MKKRIEKWLARRVWRAQLESLQERLWIGALVLFMPDVAEGMEW